MKLEKLFSRDSHLSFGLLFAGAALLLFAYKLLGFPVAPGFLVILSALCVLIIPFTGLALHRRKWLIAPIIGLAATITSALYSTTVYPTTPCGSTVTSQGYPYPWIRHFILPSDSHCPLYFQSTGNQIAIYGIYPSPITADIYLITDIVFYALLALSILELVTATRAFRSTKKKKGCR